MTREQAINYLISSGFSEEQVSEVVRALTYESTTKNDLGVDCISRDDVERMIERNYGLCWNENDYYDRLLADLDNLPSITPQEPRWISTGERLPDTDDEVLCWYEYYHWSREKVLPEYGIGCYFKETSAWYGEVAVGRDVRVIAWMPLPKPYEPQESEDKE